MTAGFWSLGNATLIDVSSTISQLAFGLLSIGIPQRKALLDYIRTRPVILEYSRYHINNRDILRSDVLVNYSLLPTSIAHHPASYTTTYGWLQKMEYAELETCWIMLDRYTLLSLDRSRF
jgi:hypothetical protein